MPPSTVFAAKPTRSATSLRHRFAPKTLVRARAPLRLGLAGGGTDVSPYCDLYGGLVVNATVGRYCHATIEAREDGAVVLAAPDQERCAGLEAADAAGLELHATVYRRMQAEFGLSSRGLTITTWSDAPAGSGLGSSSTLVVSLVEAFREFFSLPLSEYDIASLAFEIERINCGLAGGRQDQYAATFGGFNVMEFSSDRVVVSRLKLQPALVRELEASLVLYYTGASRCSAEIIKSQREHIWAADPERLDATHALKKEAMEMRDALALGDLPAVARIVHAGWEAKKRLADGISTAEIEEVFEVALEAGALAGKVSGAGGGGYLMLLVEPVRRPELVRRLAELPGGRVEPVYFVEEGATAWSAH